MSDWIKSDYCNECGGDGYYQRLTHDTGEYQEHEKEQCEECERLHLLEIRADRRMDEIKEGI